MMNSSPSNRFRGLFVAACLAMLSFGIVMTTLGSILPSLFAKIPEISKADAGSLILLMSLGILIGSLLFGPIVDRFGYKMILVVGVFLISLCLVVIAWSEQLLILRITLFVNGLGGGIINGSANALVVDIAEGKNKGARLSLLGIFFGLGAAGIPFLLGSLEPYQIAYEVILTATSALMVPLLIYILILSFPAAKMKQGFPLRDGIQLLKHPTMWILGAILFLESGLEITSGSWATTFLKENLAVAHGLSLYLLSFYWLGMMLSRLALNSILSRYSNQRALYGSFALGIVGALCLIATTHVFIAGIGIFLLGAGFAGAFPIVLGFIGAKYATLSGTAFSLAFVMALCGGMLLPWLTGIMGGIFSLRAMLSLIPALILIQAGLLALFSRLSTSPTD